MHKPVAIIGAGGHAAVIADLLRKTNRQCIAIVDKVGSLEVNDIHNAPVLSEESFLAKYSPNDVEVALGIGSLPHQNIRQEVFERFIHNGFTFPALIHPQSVVADNICFGDGVQVLAGAIIQANSKCADNVIVNTRASVDHHCHIQAHSHIAPGSVLCGNVSVGSGAFIGAGAVITQGISLGNGSVVGAGSVVVSDVKSNTTVKGVPARS